MSFAALGLGPALCQTLAGLDHDSPTAVQAAAIPPALAGQDLLVAARTGSGKTAAFTLPLIERLASGPRAASARPAALVLVPTRELAEQVALAGDNYAQGSYLSIQAVFGGYSLTRQGAALDMGVDMLVATPGRLLDFLRRDMIDLSAVQHLVLDEADRMLDLGFARDLADIAEALPRTRQTLMFSATYGEPVRKLARQWLRNPLEIDAAPVNTAAPAVRQRLVVVDKKRKAELFLHLLAESGWTQVLAFVKTREGADQLAATLQDAGVACDALHSDRNQYERQRALDQFAAGALRVLVATDVAARGLDIADLPCVFNIDLPVNASDYIHRIGRTGRAGASGDAVSLVAADEAPRLLAIEALLGKALRREEVDGFAPEHQLPASARLNPLSGGNSGAGKPMRGATGAGYPSRPGGTRGAGGKPGAGKSAGHGGGKDVARGDGKAFGKGTGPTGGKPGGTVQSERAGTGRNAGKPGGKPSGNGPGQSGKGEMFPVKQSASGGRATPAPRPTRPGAAPHPLAGRQAPKPLARTTRKRKPG